MKGLRRVGACTLEAANAYLGQVFVPLWNRRFVCAPRMAGDAHRALPPGADLDSALSIRVSRTLAADHTVRWDGVLYGMAREHIARAMAGARVELERRLDGSRWLRWRNQVIPLQTCASCLPLRCKPPLPQTARAERSATEKARARQRLLAGREQWKQNYERLAPRPLWQALKDTPATAAMPR